MFSFLAPAPDTFDAEIAASCLIASLTLDQRGAATTAPSSGGGLLIKASQVWERCEFLGVCASNTALLTELLEDWLADALPVAPRLSAAMASLFVTLESEVEAYYATRLASFQSVCANSGLSPPRVALMLRSRAFQSYIREVLSVWLLDEAKWRVQGKEIVGLWLEGLRPPPAPPPSAVHVSRLCDMAATHLRLMLWPQVVDANVCWRFRGCWEGGAKAVPYDGGVGHALFSLTGKPVGEGAMVLAVAPRLLGREPLCSMGGEGGARAALAGELADLGGARCRCVVIESPSAGEKEALPAK